MVAIHPTSRDTTRVVGRRFYLGDPCHAFPEDRPEYWEGVCDYMRDHGGYDRDHLVPVGAHTILVFPTKRGDGVYPGGDGRNYGVDSGTLGLVPLELIERMHGGTADMPAVMARLERLGRFIGNPDRDAIIPCVNRDGNMAFGDIRIDTTGNTRRAPDGWRFDDVGDVDGDGIGCPHYERVEQRTPGERCGLGRWADGNGVLYTEEYRTACALVLRGIMDAGEMPDECEGCPDRPGDPAAWRRKSNGD